MIKKVTMFFLMAGFVFAEVGEDSKPEWFFGFGLGAGLETIEESVSLNNKDVSVTSRDLSTAFRGKVGGIYYSPSNIIGVRYYYSLDYNVSSRRTVNAERQYRAYYSAFINLINIDMLIRLGETKENNFHLIAGVASGVRVSMGSRSNLRYDRAEHFLGTISKALAFESSLNVGLRWMHQRKYGLELMTRIPLNDITTGPKPGPAGTQFFDKLRQHFSMTLDFVVEL